MPLKAAAALDKDKRSAKFGAVSTLQHRHYAAIAGIIAELPQEHRAVTALHFADKLSANPRFDHDRFMAACMGD